MRVTWEASIQHISIAQRLSLVDDPHLEVVRNLEDEERVCRARLGDVTGRSAREIRRELREVEFSKWTELVQRGIGVHWFKVCPQANSWVGKKGALSSSEWTNAIKASMNSMANRATGGRSVGSRRCRVPTCSENETTETLPHIRGSCPKTELLRNNAHHKVRTAIADIFRAKSYEVFEEVHCVAQADGHTQNRRADIVVVDRENGRGWVLDPTIRWETNDRDQDRQVDEEKKRIYEPCIPFLSQQYGVGAWEVVGLWFGARGTASKLLLEFFKAHNIPKASLFTICMLVLRDTLRIIQFFLYT